MSGDELVWLDAEGHYVVHRDVAPAMAATVLALQARQARLDGGGLLRPGVGAACRRIGELSAKRRRPPISATGNENDGNATMNGWDSPSVAAGRVGFTGRRVRQLASSGQITSRRFGRLLLVERNSLDEYVNRHGRKGCREKAAG